MYDFTTKNMSDLLYNDLSTIQDNEGLNTEAVLTTPTTESTLGNVTENEISNKQYKIV